MALRQRASPVSKALPIASPSHRTTSTILATGACPSRSPGAEVRRGICLYQTCCATRPRKRRKKRPAGTKPCLLRKKQNLDQQPSRVALSYSKSTDQLSPVHRSRPFHAALKALRAHSKPTKEGKQFGDKSRLFS